jgi:lactoylglutathione lyase
MRLGYTIIYVEDVRQTVEFYERCFSLKRRFVTDEGDYAEMETGATALAFAQNELAAEGVPDFRKNTPDDTPAGFQITLVTDDVQAAYDHAVDNGAISLNAPASKPWGQTVAYVRDLNGVVVEFGSPMG